MDGISNYKKLIIFVLSCSFRLSFHHVQAQDPYLQDCSSSVKYTSNSQYQTNLNVLLRSLVSNGARNGFFNNTIGTSPDTVYGLVQCRGDISMQDCRTCLNTASVEILKRCPNQKSAALRYEYCILRYSGRKFSGKYDGVFRALYNTQNVSDAVAYGFHDRLERLLSNLSIIAATSRVSRDYWDSIDYVLPIRRIYGLVQCTTDLSPGICFTCLENALESLKGCCIRSRGAQIYSKTCYVRYELYSFAQRPPPTAKCCSPAAILYK